MLDLIKVDLKRIIKDKLFLIVWILGGVFAIINPLLNKFLLALMSVEEMAQLGMMGMVINAKSNFFGAFTPGNNFGLIFPVFMVIILCKDFSYGTVRNKVLAGKSRLQIFLASFTATAIVTCLTMLAHALLSLGVSLLFFEYQSTPFTANDFGYLLLSVLFEMLVYTFISSLLACICVAMKNLGLAIVTYVSATFLMTIVGSVTLMMQGMGTQNGVIEFLNKANLFTSTIIGGGVSYSFSDILYVIIPTVAGTAVFLVLGWLAFRKKDLK